jgi:mono/diheme cytochrome c family protein
MLGSPLGLVLAAVAAYGADQPAPDFARDIQPIFASHCYKCHGPEKQTSGLRLDDGAAALAGGDSGAAIVPGKADKSPLIERATSTEESTRMPPEGAALSAEQIDLLRRWIDTGANWPASASAVKKEQHWSLRPIVRPALPAIQNPKSKIQNAIDAFILHSLEARQLSPSSPADRRTLIRRLSFDLVGLPPTPEEVAAFVADVDPLAYEKLVDRLLASPRHGERWAQHWLDAVRFAESDGCETNKPRANAWPYRDYVIESLNADKPYDQFVREQLAGDALGVDEATGFLVGGANDVVTSPDPVLTAQQRADVLHDIVSTTGSTFLGLTVGCARCHNHKFDPIPQADYYALKAVFAGVAHGERPRTIPRDPQREEGLAALRTRLEELDAQLLRYEPLADTTTDPAVLVAEKRLRPAVHPRLNIERFAPISAKRVRLTVHKTNLYEPCIDEFEVLTAEESPRNVALASIGTKAAASSVYPNSTIHRLEHINDGQLGNGRSWISNEQRGGWIELEFAVPQQIDTIRWGRDREEKFTDRLALEYTLEVADESGKWITIATHRDREPFAAGQAFNPAAAMSRLPAAEQEAAQSAAGERAKVEAEIKQLSAQPMLYAGVFTAIPGATNRFHRGDPTSPREEIPPGGLRTIPVVFDSAGTDGTRSVPATLTEDQRRRLALSDWIVDPANPLTARVIVNRLWQHHFGEGLVATPSDFGANGARASHPELLDWLAAELLENGWRLRPIHKLIVMSATYRQSAANPQSAISNPQLVDADNRLLWRYPSRRLEAEPLRDAILTVGGKLDLTMGGPGFLAFEPNDNYVRIYNPKQSFGPADFRRMVYMTKIRMHQDGTFGAFDCPDGGQIAPRRATSTTPLQALNLLNGPFATQQADFFAARIKADAGEEISAQVRRAFQLAYQRDPAPAEQSAAAVVVKDHGLPILCRAILNSNEFLYVD